MKRATRIICIIISGGMTGITAAAAPEPPVVIEVHADKNHAYVDFPMHVRLPGRPPPGAVILMAGNGRRMPGQIWNRHGVSELIWIHDRLLPGARERLRVLPATPTAVPGVGVEAMGNNVRVTLRGKPFTTYRARSGSKPICYPLYGPGDKPMTRNFPMRTDVPGERRDHPHHRSFWFAHGSVNGIDFWTEGKGRGCIIQRSISAMGGPAAGVIETDNDWIGPDGRRVCRDHREIVFYNVRRGRMFDVSITVSAPDGPVTFGDTKEGTLAFRTAATMKPTAGLGGIVVNAHGEKNKTAWGKRAYWVDASGPVTGAVVGIAILEHPSSFRAPTYWQARTYGLVAANPFGLHNFLHNRGRDGEYTIPKNHSITFRYRVWLHTGHADEAGVASVWQEYAAPPKIIVRTSRNQSGPAGE